MMIKSIQIIKDRLYWVSDAVPPKNISKSLYFNIDADLEYEPFYLDFGPLNLGKTWKYVTQLEKLLAHPEHKANRIYHHTSDVPQKAANAAFLMGAYLVISQGLSGEKAFEPFRNISFRPFRDASYNKSCSYKCTLLDCLRGLDYGIKLQWFNPKKFNLNEYEHYERVQNGDLNWIIPNKFVAFSSPYDMTTDKYGNRMFTPADYVPVFKKLGVTMVIRLNNHTYEAKGFTKEGIRHHDLIFPDGTPPSLEICEKFLDIVEKEPGAVAVHCKAGLGRTGSLIACYAMKHFRFPAADFIGWIRVARPGSILGPQQHFLIQIQKKMFERSHKSQIWSSLKDHMEQKHTVDKLNVTISSINESQNLNINKHVEMNEREKEIIEKGDIGQGENLVEAKMKREKLKNATFNAREQRSSSKTNSKNQSAVNSPPKKEEKRLKY